MTQHFIELMAIWVHSTPCSMLFCPFVSPACDEPLPHQTVTTSGTPDMKHPFTSIKTSILLLCATHLLVNMPCYDLPVAFLFLSVCFGFARICALSLLQTGRHACRQANRQAVGRAGKQAGRQAYTCGMWREAPAFNNNTIHKTPGTWLP